MAQWATATPGTSQDSQVRDHPPTPQAGEHVAWVRDAWEGIRRFSTGGNYVNFQVADDDAARTAAAYGTNWERLRRVKATYDPHNLFRVNRNVGPASG